MNGAMRDLTAFNSLIAILYNPERPLENSALVCFCGRSARVADPSAGTTDGGIPSVGHADSKAATHGSAPVAKS